MSLYILAQVTPILAKLAKIAVIFLTGASSEESVHEMTALSCVLGEGYPQRSSASNLPRFKRPLAFSLLNFVQKFANKVFGSLPFSVVKFRHLQFQTCTVFT